RLRAPPQPADLPALRDQPVLRVPHLGLFVEPAAADVPAPGGDPQRPGRGNRAHVPGELHRRRPAERAEPQHHRRQRIHRQGEQVRRRLTLLTPPATPAPPRPPPPLPPQPPALL